MPFKADTYRVMIASPSDLSLERQAVADAISDWNAQHAAAEATVLLPVKWETHATPEIGRPQGVLNTQLVDSCDLLVGMFWTKFGASTGVAESATIEEIERIVGAGKPAMLYFSTKPVDPNKIDLDQQKKLRDFKEGTYKTALVDNFNSTVDLHSKLLRHLMVQVRKWRLGRRSARRDRIDQVSRLAEMMVSFKQHGITPAHVHQFRDELLAPRPRAGRSAPELVKPGEVGPNGYRVSYLRNGDKVEWQPDDENPGQEWPMILRRGDKAITSAAEEFETVVWYDRKLVLQQKVKAGEETIVPDIEKGMLAAMEAAEKKYGKKKIRSYYTDDFGWGMLNGKLSALRWVLGEDWDMLDT